MMRMGLWNMQNGKFITVLGWVATFTAIAMYVSYVSQIRNNLNGVKGDWLQPLVAVINCTLWVAYGLFKKPKKDWPIIVANVPGIVFGVIASVTAFD